MDANIEAFLGFRGIIERQRLENANALLRAIREHRLLDRRSKNTHASTKETCVRRVSWLFKTRIPADRNPPSTLFKIRTYEHLENACPH
ncbi:MAG: hypothetical protein AAF564_15950 [Bacteroidota bacterium]